MALQEAMVQTMPGNEPAAPAAPAETPGKFPEVVAKDPAVRMVLEKKVPGVVVPPEKRYAQADAVGEYAQLIQDEMGLQFYQSPSEAVALFNPLVISFDEVSAADKAGKLYEIFPEYGELTGATPSEGEGEVTQAPAAGMIPPTPQGMPKAPKGTITKTQQGRMKNMVPSVPPGASNILGGIQAKAF